MLGKIIKSLLEVPESTPYLPLLLECGMWTMMGRIHYKKLRLYHNILNSSDDRLLKRIVLIQEEEERKGTWYEEITKIILKYDMKDMEVRETPKSTWKRIAKRNISTVMEQKIRHGCSQMTKGRTVAEDRFERKRYLDERTVEESRWITKMRLHMTDIPCNYGQGEVCWLCGCRNATSEHYFECPETETLRKCWNIESCEQMKPTEIVIAELLNCYSYSGFKCQIK